MTNLETAKAVVDAFQRGDIPSLLDHLAEDVEWEYGSTNDVPWYRERRGKMDVRDFFASLDQVDFKQWEPTQYFADGDVVIVVIDSDYVVKRTERRVVYKDCLLMFRFDRHGRVSQFAHRTDLLAGWLAYHDKDIAV